MDKMTVKQASDEYWSLKDKQMTAYDDYERHPNDITWENYCEAVEDVGAFLAYVEVLGLNVVEVTNSQR